ncbi:MAG: hypothetical protein QY320_06125 [Gammaproteobacteria bacterium]|nr:MAG: hypothetical protein QY320_06125 [Gammaproteobacteria bacterium]
MWRAVRITILSVILVIVAGLSWGDRFRTTRWSDSLWIGLFPVNGDDSAAAADYMASLGTADFADIEAFFAREARTFGVALERPVRVDLHPPVGERPPQLAPGAGPVDRLWWSLRLRYYTWRMAGDTLADIRVFVLFHDPDRSGPVPDSHGLQEGLLGVVYAYATPRMAPQNNIVITHEALHALGASDKYDPATRLPLFPSGYGEPDAEPRYPQRFAEVMAVRRALTPTEAEMPPDLGSVVVGTATAAEINWIDD